MQTVTFESFEGPLDLLLNLLTKNEIDIYDIPIAKITEQYMQYLYTAQELNIDLAADFVIVAAQLIEIKSKMMLPPDEEEAEDYIDPRDELVARLLEYKVFKQITTWVKNYEEGYNETLGKDAEYFPQLKDDYFELELDVEMLTAAMRNLFSKYQLRINEDILADYSVTREEISTEDMIINISQMLEEKDEISFFSVLEGHISVGYIISSFMAILEMLKMSVVTIEQDGQYQDIIIRKISQ